MSEFMEHHFCRVIRVSCLICHRLHRRDGFTAASGFKILVGCVYIMTIPNYSFQLF